MRYRVIPARELSDSEEVAWRAILQDAPNLDSPYLHPEFTRCVAAIRTDLEVVVIESDSGPVGFFPFQRVSRAEARPVGGRLNDCHRVIALPNVDWKLEDLLKAARLSAFEFHYLDSTEQFAPYARREFESVHLDLSAGYAEYVANLNSRRVVTETARKQRKLEREVGTIRFEWESDEEAAFEQLIKWKSAQYVRSTIADVMSFGWTVDLLKECWHRNGREFEGLLSTMYAGDQLVAVHFGIRADSVLHQWFPAYDVEFSNYSPGLIHLMSMAEAANTHDVSRIDLGEVCGYKSRVMSGGKTMYEGGIDNRHLRRLIRCSYEATRDWVKNSPLRVPAQLPGRWIRQLCERAEFR